MRKTQTQTQTETEAIFYHLSNNVPQPYERIKKRVRS